MYASTFHSPPKVDFPYQEQQQLSGSSSSKEAEPPKDFSKDQNEDIKRALAAFSQRED